MIRRDTSLLRCASCGALSLDGERACWRCGEAHLIPCGDSDVTLADILRLAGHIAPNDIVDKIACEGLVADICPTLVDATGLISIAFECGAVRILAEGRRDQLTFARALDRMPSYIDKNAARDLLDGLSGAMEEKGKALKACASKAQEDESEAMLDSTASKALAEPARAHHETTTATLPSVLDSPKSASVIAHGAVSKAFRTKLTASITWSRHPKECWHIYDTVRGILAELGNRPKTTPMIRLLAEQFIGFCSDPASLDALEALADVMSLYRNPAIMRDDFTALTDDILSPSQVGARGVPPHESRRVL